MRDINELKIKKASLIEEARSFDEEHTRGGRQMTTTEGRQYESMVQEAKSLVEQIKREEELQQEEMRNAPNGPAYFRMEPWESGPNSSIQTIPSIRVAQNKSYRGMFYPGNPHRPLDGGGFKGKNEFYEVLSSGLYDSRLQQVRTMTEGTPSAGGFAVPEEFAAEWFDNALENEVIRPRATVWPMKSETRKVPAWDDSDHSSDELYGGLSIAWLAEAGTATRQTPKLRQIILTTKKGAIYVAASREVVQDGMDFEAQLERALAKSLGWGLDDSFINGHGAGQPLGILNADSTIEVSKETSQAADTIVYENLLAMESRLLPSCMLRAVWIANVTAYVQLNTMSIAVGTGGTAIKALTRRNNEYYLLDRPLFFTEKCPVLGDAGDIILADLSKYYIGLRQDLAIDKSNIPGWTTDTIDWRIICRVDGQPVFSEAFTPKNGDSLSWAVKLEARS